MRPRLELLVIALALQGCSMAPVYKAPAIDLPAQYREQTSDGPWHLADPAQQLSTQWWTLYQDSRLNDLQQQLLKANPDLAAALAHFDAAQAYAGQLHAGLFPQITASAQPLRQRQSEDKPLRGSNQPSVYNSNTAGFALNFDPDLWGKIRNQVAAGDAQAQASADDLAAARLSLQQQLATLYIQLNGLDAQQTILASSLDDYTQALQLTRDRYEGAIASELDLTRAQSQLAEARAQLDDVRAQRGSGGTCDWGTGRPTGQCFPTECEQPGAGFTVGPRRIAQHPAATPPGHLGRRTPGICRQRQHRRRPRRVVPGLQPDRPARRANRRQRQSVGRR